MDWICVENNRFSSLIYRLKKSLSHSSSPQLLFWWTPFRQHRHLPSAHVQRSVKTSITPSVCARASLLIRKVAGAEEKRPTAQRRGRWAEETFNMIDRKVVLFLIQLTVSYRFFPELNLRVCTPMFYFCVIALTFIVFGSNSDTEETANRC